MNGCGHGTNEGDDFSFKDHVLCLIPKAEFSETIQRTCVAAVEAVDGKLVLTKNRYSVELCKRLINSFVIV
jgi:hypothetical protein